MPNSDSLSFSLFEASHYNLVRLIVHQPSSRFPSTKESALTIHWKSVVCMKMSHLYSVKTLLFSAALLNLPNLGYALCSSTSLRESTDSLHNAPCIPTGAVLSTSSIIPQGSNGPLKQDQVQEAEVSYWLFTPGFAFGISGFFNQDSKDKNGTPLSNSADSWPAVCSSTTFNGQLNCAPVIDKSLHSSAGRIVCYHLIYCRTL